MLSRNKILLGTAGLLVLFFLLTYLLPLGVRPLIRPDEFRYAEIPREMLETGDWVTPRLNGVRYFEKPGLGYQLTALSFAVFGENAFALRLPSVLAVLLTAAFLHELVRRRSRDPFLPGLSALIYLSFGLVFGVGTFAVLDSQLTAALSLCIGSFYLACESRRRSAVVGWLISSGFWAGCAFLIKGFLAFAVPVVVLVPYLAWQREWKRLFLYAWIPLIVAAAVALPWSWLIHQAEPDFWRYFFIEEHWHRFTSRTYDRKPQPFWYFVPFLLGGVLPAGLLAVPGISGTGRDRLKNPLTRFLLCWAAMPFLLFSASSCKLGTYILPCFPPLAVLLALGIRRAMLLHNGRCRKSMTVISRCLGAGLLVIGGAGIIALPVWGMFPDLPQPYPDFSIWPYLTLLCGVGFGAFLLHAAGCYRTLRMIAVFLFGFAPVIFCGLQAVPTALLGNKAPETGIRKCLKQIPVRPDDIVLVDRNSLTAAAWILKRSDLIVIGKPGELEYGFKNYPEYASRHYPESELPAVIEQSRPHRVIYIVLRDLERHPIPAEWNAAEITTADEVTMIRF